ncbi:VPS2B [Auxenochlorella protothecoides x Auxenochlorella symbiontica]
MSALKGLFKKPDPRAQLRTSQREVTHNVRDIEREVLALRREEAKTLKDIKAAARSGNMAGAKILAQQLVRLRGHMAKMQTQAANLRGVNISMATAATTGTVGASLASAGKAMAAVGAAADLPGAQKAAQQFARESFAMDMAADVMDSALETDDLEEETDDVVNQVLDEIGVDLSAAMAPAGKARVASDAKATTITPGQEEDDILARLTALK